jgi:hypothetical protein
MPIPFFVSPEGVPMVLDTPTTPTREAERHEPTLAEIAQENARKQSTKIKD